MVWVLLSGGLLSAAPAHAVEEGVTFPFYPSFLQIEDGKTTSLEDWSDPMVCGSCHPRQYEGWKSSMHANAFIDPVFQAEWAKGYQETDGEVLNLCGGCHTPIGVMTGTVKYDPDVGKYGGFTAPGVAAMGVSCDVCHSVADTNARHTTTGNPGNASLVLAPGDVKRATLKDAVSPFHATEYSELHGRAELCANCHNIFHPNNNFPIEHTYDEWKMSAYAQNDIQCQDCHMVPVETAIRVADTMTRARDLPDHGLGGMAGVGAAGPREIVHDHGFVGGNTVIAGVLGVPGAEDNRAEAIKRLQNVADLDIEIIPGMQGANLLRVKVTNARAGHHLPTSLTFIRQVWLEVEVRDDQGRLLLSSGALEDNRVPEDAVMFTNKSVDQDGNLTVDPWRIAGFVHMNTIPPKGYRYGTYSFRLPEDASSFTVDAKLNYQSYHQDLADKLLGEGALEVPVVTMRELTRRYNAADLGQADADRDSAVAHR
ncbi:cytochrome C [Thioalkalivibrio paradoxus ARh 1]|uniref:Cytochrome C n=1 Tax=Thioalkalivibrio paradoxus ARh 1 TaxID=713585 RepID=W0DIC6_9GAMM|nr:cytochrome C [Thioalkalivibrio paradoxus ARh 1]